MGYTDWADEGHIIKAGDYYKIACCGCGLVHDYFFEKAGRDKLLIKIERSERATGQMRRWMKVKKEGMFNGGNAK